MTKFTEFNRKNLSTVDRVISKHLEEAAKELGFSLETGNISFGSNSFTMKINGAITQNGESPREVKYRQDLIRYSKITGVKEEHIGATITTSKGDAKLVGYSPKSTKYPFLVKLPNGRLLKCMESQVKRELGLTKPMGGLTKTPAPTSFGLSPDGKGFMGVTPKPPMNLNERQTLDYIKHAISSLSGSDCSCSMDDVLKAAKKDESRMKDSSIMVYVGNLKKKGYITRDHNKNIHIA